MIQEWNATIMVLIFSLPVITSVICAIIVAIYGHETRNIPFGLPRQLTTALLVWAFVWGCIVMYIQWPTLFVVFQVPFFYALLVFHALFYRIICLITGTGKKEYFSGMHYIIPAILPAVLLVWSFFVPIDVQKYIVESRGQAVQGYETYSALFTSKSATLVIWCLTYIALSFKRIITYRRMIGDYSADEGRSPVRWLRILTLFMFSGVPLPLILFGAGKAVFISSLWVLLPVGLTVLEIIMLCYNIVSENYIVITDADEKANTAPQGKVYRIKREDFEHYIHTKKPYLNPRIRITDIASDLHSNRTYLSHFINNEYGMNFSRYINLQRLKELDVLHHDPKKKEVSGIELLTRAGFSTYRGYTRAKADVGKISLLKEVDS